MTIKSCPMTAATRRPILSGPAPLPCGGSTLARCTHCGEPYVPTTAHNIFCSPRCGDVAKQQSPAARARAAGAFARNASYRVARKALRRAGVEPDSVADLETLRGKGVVDGWRSLVGLSPPSRRSAEAPPADVASLGPWDMRCPTAPLHIGTFVALSVRPAPWSAITLRHTRLLHGALSRVTGMAHEPQRGTWSLAPVPPFVAPHSCGWGVFFYPPSVLATEFSAPVPIHFGGMAADIAAVGVRVRVRAPAPLPPGRYRVTIESITPISWARDGHGVAVLAPTVDTMRSACETIARKILADASHAHVDQVSHDTAREAVYVGGHIQRGSPKRGVVIGIVGVVTIECNAPAAWLLRCAEYTGIGGATAFGFGRVVVRVEVL